MLRVGMTNPPYILEHLEAMVDILNHPRVYSFLHVPVQSGSNPVLDKMNREYLVEEFMEVCDFLVEHVPDMTLATDIICGFPTETEEHFKETLDLVEKYKFPVLNISQFYPRPGTVAAKWKKVPTADVKKRSSALTKLFDSYTTNIHYLGEELLVWIIGFDDRKQASAMEHPQLLGHTKGYTKVVLDQVEASEVTGQPASALVGKVLLIKVTETHKWHVSGHILDASPKIPHADPTTYFPAKKKEWAAKKQQAGEDIAKAKVRVIEERIKVIGPSQDQFLLHLIGMLLLSLGVYSLLKGLSHQSLSAAAEVPL